MREQLLAAEKVKAIDWRDGALHLLDQRVLPFEETWHRYDSAAGVAEAIRQMVVRGAPAIGIAAAYGVVLGARARLAAGGDWRAALEADFRVLAESRPTAVNLFWALDRMRERLERLADDEEVLAALEAEAVGIHDSDREANLTMAQLGVELIRRHDAKAQKLLTHCNTGALATGGAGTALAVIAAAWDAGRRFTVFADETRPLFQGSRLTAWELVQRGIPVTVLCDSAAGHLMATGQVASVIVGADRITACGDTANKIGTYSLAVLAHAHGIPFFVAAPSSTFDLTLDSGDEIPIEQRAAAEVLAPLGVQAAPAGAAAFNPAFDVTPARLIHGIITERGVISPVTRPTVRSTLGR